MLPRFRTLILFVLIFLAKLPAFCQNNSVPNFRNGYIDEEIFPTAHKGKQPIKTLLSQGYRAFVITQGSHFEQSEMVGLKTFFSENPNTIIAFIFETDTKWETPLKAFFKDNIIHLSKAQLPIVQDLVANKKQLLFFGNAEKNTWLLYAKLGKTFPSAYKHVFVKNNPRNVFTYFEYDSLYHPATANKTLDTIASPKITSLNNAVNAYLYRTGKFPNFITNSPPDSINAIKNRLPLTVKVDVLDSLGISLPNVHWKENPMLVSNGIAHLTSKSFSYKKTSGRYTGILNAVPYKEGYDFIPEIFSFNANTYDNFKIFKSKQVSLSKGLVFYLPLDNKTDFSGISVSENNLHYKKDSVKNHFAFFKTVSDNLYFETSPPLNNIDAMSISFWFCPGKKGENHSILSAAESFVFKLRKGHLCLTFPGIKDVISEKFNVALNTWQHVAITCTNDNSVKFYRNGNLVDEIAIKNVIKPVRNSFILGSDQWGELYDGGLKSVAFWNRAISPEEVSAVYKYNVDGYSEKHTLPTIIGILVLGVLALTFGIGYYLKKKTKPIPNKSTTEETDITTSKTNDVIQCFGNFKVLDNSGKNLLDDLSLKKKIFLFVVLYHTLKEGGISPSKLSEVLWPGYSPKRAKNIRSTYLQAIRNCVSSNKLKIIYENKKWSIWVNKDINIDLKHYFKLHEKLSAFKTFDDSEQIKCIEKYIEVIDKGTLINDLQSELVDDYKTRTHTEIIDNLERFLNYGYHNPNPDFIYRLASTIFIFDPTNEDALKHKLRVLSDKNKAKKCFEQFSKRWEAFYNETYKADETITKLLQ
ncbi:MAG: LamG domain-containing protein [Flavobacteriaceae bacterium]